MNIYSIYIGKNLNQEISDSEELFDEMYGLKTVRIKSKRENKNGESMDTVFLLNSVSNQHFKVPKRILENLEIKDDCRYYSPWLNDTTNECGVFMKNTILNSKIENENLDILLNNMTLTPYIGKNIHIKKEPSYCILTLDTDCVQMISYEKESSIIGTFRQPSNSIVGCIIRLDSETPFRFYVHDKCKQYNIKCVTIELDEDNSIKLEVDRNIPKDKVKELSIQYKKKGKTRTFFYNDFEKHLPKITLTHDKKVISNTDFVKIPTREEAGSNSGYIKTIEKQLIRAVGYLPKAIILDTDVEIEYNEMLRLHFNYVIKKCDDGKYVTLKSS